jgi:hypothetical protein
MKIRKIEYQPVIFGTLCEKECKTDRGLARRIQQTVGESVLLPFKVEKRYLKNVVLTMRLMDIAGLVVSGSHRRHILKHVPRLDRSARDARMVDTVARREGTFVGYCTEEMALSEWRKISKDKGSSGARPPSRKLALRARDIRVELLTSPVKSK